MTKLLSVLFAVVALGSVAVAADAQTMFEVTGDVGTTQSNVNELLGPGVFDPTSLSYGASASLLFGRRGPRGLMLGGEVGYSHMLAYNFIFQGERFEDAVDGFRLLVLTRFWFSEGAWFGEAGAGVIRLNGIKGSGPVHDPILSAGAGTFFDLSEKWAIVAKVRGSVTFDSGSPMLTGLLHAGMSYSFGS